MDFNREAIEKQNAHEQLLAQMTNEANARLQEQANATNIEIADKTNAMNKAIADQNLGFQREQQEYEENLQKQIFEREDTAYQRTAQDMRNAGISPLAMSGTNGAGTVVGRTPSNNGMVAEGTTVGATRYEKAQQHLFQKQFREQAKNDMASQIFNGIGEMANQMLDMQNKSAMVKEAEAKAKIAQVQANREEDDYLSLWGLQKENPFYKTNIGHFKIGDEKGSVNILKKGYRANGNNYGGSHNRQEREYRFNKDKQEAWQWQKTFDFGKAQDELNRAFADRVQSFNEQMGIVNAITGGVKTLGGLLSPF